MSARSPYNPRAASASSPQQGVFDIDGLADSIGSVVQSVGRRLVGRTSGPSPYITRDPSGKLRGLGMTVCGGVLIAGAVGAGVAGGILSFIANPAAVVGGAICGFIAILSGLTGGWLCVRGIGTNRLAKALDSVSYTASKRVQLPFSEVVDAIHLPADMVRKIICNAIERGFIPQGHLGLDGGHEVLYLTDGAYDAGVQKMQEYENHAMEIAARYEQDAQLPERARMALSVCEVFRQRMSEASQCIEDRQVRSLISEMTVKVKKIEAHVRKRPQDASRIGRFTTYYLPTTAKLTETRAGLDAGNITGDNADATRAEVDGMLAMVSNALDQLLEEFMRDQNWDVASDVSVMRTMLQQDGLTRG